MSCVYGGAPYRVILRRIRLHPSAVPHYSQVSGVARILSMCAPLSCSHHCAIIGNSKFQKHDMFGTCLCSNDETSLFQTCLVSGLLSFQHTSVIPATSSRSWEQFTAYACISCKYSCSLICFSEICSILLDGPQARRHIQIETSANIALPLNFLRI